MDKKHIRFEDFVWLKQKKLFDTAWKREHSY